MKTTNLSGLARTSTNEELSWMPREQASIQQEGGRLGSKPKAVSHDKKSASVR